MSPLSAHSLSHTAIRMHVVGSAFSALCRPPGGERHPLRGMFGSSANEAYQHSNVYRSGEKRVEEQRGRRTSLPRPLGDFKPFQVLAIIRTHASY